MKRKIALILIIACLFSLPAAVSANLAQSLSGRILLQVQSSGQAWYVNPANNQRYFLGRPDDAFNIMRRLGLGISEADFNKLAADENLVNRLKGKIILRVQAAGQAYYINPINGQKYYLGRPADAFNIMKLLALGITDANLAKITVAQLSQAPATGSDGQIPSRQSILAQAADSIRSNNATQTKTFFTADLHKAIEYTLLSLSADSRLLLANILSGATLESQNDTEKIYKNTAYFSLGSYEVPLHFYVKKQSDGTWLITNL